MKTFEEIGIFKNKISENVTEVHITDMDRDVILFIITIPAKNDEEIINDIANIMLAMVDSGIEEYKIAIKIHDYMKSKYQWYQALN